MLNRIAVLVFALSIMMLSGCSSLSHHNADSPPINEPDTHEQSNTMLLGIWNLKVDPDNHSVVEFDREMAAHFDITQLIPDPVITNESYNSATKMYQADVTLQNTLDQDMFDMRLIGYVDDAGYMLKNYDCWTTLYDIPGGSFANPFKAYAKTQPSRRFANGASHTETVRIYLPGGSLYPNVLFSVEASFPNCDEPYLINNFTQEDIGPSVGSSGIATVDVFDWQNDVNSVQLMCPAITNNATDNFAYQSGNTWSLNLVNNNGVPLGQYLALISATSTESGSSKLYYIVYVNIMYHNWAKRAGGIVYDEGHGITTLSDNSTVVTGYFCDLATFGPGEPNQTVLTSVGSFDIFIARYNPNGTLAWAKRAGGTGYDEGYGITPLSDNSTVVTGHFVGTATFGPGESNQIILTSAGNDDIFIARYNPDGTLSWAKRAGGSDWDEGIAITTLSDNSTVVTGDFWGTATFGPGDPNQTVLDSAGGIDIFIARYNPDGTLSWAKRAGGTDHEQGCGITTLSDNSTVVTGYFWGIVTFGPGEPNVTVLTSAGSWDMFIARYNPDGTLSWAKRAGGTSGDGCYGITTLSDNSTVVPGLFRDSATFGQGEPSQTILTSAGSGDIFIARYNPDGTLSWAKRAGGIDYEYGYEITTLSDNSTVMTGFFEGSATFGPSEANETVLTSAGYEDIFIARYNPDGTLAWAKLAGGSDNDYGNGITTLSDNSTVVTGYFVGSATFGPGEPGETILTSDGNRDIFIARYAP